MLNGMRKVRTLQQPMGGLSQGPLKPHGKSKPNRSRVVLPVETWLVQHKRNGDALGNQEKNVGIEQNPAYGFLD